MKYQIFFFLILLSIISCNDDYKTPKEIENIPIDINYVRFDRLFSKQNQNSFNKLKQTFPKMFEGTHDSIWIKKLNDTLQIKLQEEIGKSFDDFNQEQKEIDLFYKHLKYKFPDFKTPEQIFTIVSDVDYNHKIIVNDSLALIGIDNYLGSENELYIGLQKFIAKNLIKERIVVDLAEVYAKHKTPLNLDRTFITTLVYYGKIEYLKSVLLPFKSNYSILGFTEEEYNFAEANEAQIWRYFISKELLYSSDQKLKRRFIDNAPFSKFGLEIDNETPGSIGKYIGFKIIEQYMRKTNSSLEEMIQTKNIDIFKESNFKPKK